MNKLGKKFWLFFFLTPVLIIATILIVQKVENTLAPNDPYFLNQQQLQEINLIEAWKLSQGENITVAVIDSGVNFGKDLNSSKFVYGFDYISNNNSSIYKAEDSIDWIGHGTHIAAIIAQDTNNEYGTAGIAPKAKIMPLRVFEYKDGDVKHLVKAIEDTINHQYGVDIINLSLEKKYIDNSITAAKLRQAIDNARQKNVIVVAAAGNKGQEITSVLNIENDKVLIVGAYDKPDRKANYSNYGNAIDIYAPGGVATKEFKNQCNPQEFNSKISNQGGILATVTTKIKRMNGQKKIEDKLFLCSGTSQAAAHVTGVIALVKSILKEKQLQSPQIVEKIILDSAQQDSLKKLDAGKATQLAYQLVNPENELIDDKLPYPDQYIESILDMGRKLHKKQKFQEALAVFQDVEKLKYSSQPNAFDDWNALCWDASINYGIKGEKESIVKIMPACEKAVKLLDNNDKLDDYYYFSIETRGLAKALIGDIPGAIKDFKEFIEHRNNFVLETESIFSPECIEFTKQHEQVWLPMLKQGQNPFTPEVLKEISKQGC